MAEAWHTKIITEEELAKHNTEDDAWVKIENTVYDVSTFHNLHPGGSKVLSRQAGTDASKLFFGLHRHEVLETWAPKLAIGRIAGAKDIPPADDMITRGDISTVPYSEPMAWMGFDQPHYYTESHKMYRKALREWVYEELILTGLAEKHEANEEKPPDELFEKMGAMGILAARLGPGSNLETWRSQIAPAHTGGKIFGVEIEDFDYFHEAITHEELGRCACPGFTSGLGDGFVIGLPPVVQFGPDWMKERVIPDVLSGKSRICLAISEPEGGSDVAGIHSTAEKTADGKHYIVNGTKKWITNGHHSKYFVTAVRTGDPKLGMGSISLLLLERGMEGLRTKLIKTSYSSTAGTALVIMEDVLVPVENLLGAENGGFMCIMYNFNHERWFIVVYILSVTRAVIEECFRWCMQRRTFGKKLMDQPVIRMKMAAMIGALEPCSHWLDSITYQMCNMEYSMQALRLAGTTSLLKYQSTRAAHLVADNAVQVFGGRGITKTGMGRMVERLNVGNKFAAILGGSEEIMADLSMKLAMGAYPANARL